MSASPVTPLTTSNLDIDANAPLCDKLKALHSAGAVIKELVAYLFDNNGNPTDGFVAAMGAKLMPVGGVIFWPSASVPDGWLILNGQAVDRTMYASIYQLFGTQFGAGNGTTTFNLPNFQDKVPLGASASKGVGSSGGAESVSLTIDMMPEHDHFEFVDAEPASGSTVNTNDGVVRRLQAGTDPSYNMTAAAAGVAATLGRSSKTGGSKPAVPPSTTPGGTPVPTLPPYIAGYWIIRF